MLWDFGALAMVTADFPDSSAWPYGCSSAFQARRAAQLCGPCLLGFKTPFCGWWWEGDQHGWRARFSLWEAEGLASPSDLTALTSMFNAEGWWSKSRNGCFLWDLPPERDVGLQVRIYMKNSSGHIGADQEEKQKMRKHCTEVRFEQA